MLDIVTVIVVIIPPLDETKRSTGAAKKFQHMSVVGEFEIGIGILAWPAEQASANGHRHSRIVAPSLVLER